jgi:hypothetical protein
MFHASPPFRQEVVGRGNDRLPRRPRRETKHGFDDVNAADPSGRHGLIQAGVWIVGIGCRADRGALCERSGWPSCFVRKIAQMLLFSSDRSLRFDIVSLTPPIGANRRSCFLHAFKWWAKSTLCITQKMSGQLFAARSGARLALDSNDAIGFINKILTIRNVKES